MEMESKVVKKRIAENGNGNEIDSVVGNGKGLGNSPPLGQNGNQNLDRNEEKKKLGGMEAMMI
jgi:hypothetical protein